MSSTTISLADEALLVAYLDGDLGLREAAALEERLTTDPTLAGALRSLTAANQFGRELARNRLPPHAASSPTPRRWRLWIVAGLVAVAAALTAMWLVA
jgi:anti-sigma factor RsiW